MGVFKFKKFSVCDDRATMKVGTDGVLLGAWADVSIAKNLLDIGTGSGIIALMMAQRTDENSRIDAVEFQAEDAQQAIENVSLSPWLEKISVIHSSIQEFISKTQYQCILCNPPYFSKSLHPSSASRRNARHDVTLSHNDLLQAAVRLLSLEGRLNVVLPPAESDAFMAEASAMKLFPTRLTRFFTRPGKNQERSLMEFRRTKDKLVEGTLMLYQVDDRWTAEYRKLTGEFYLER